MEILETDLDTPDTRKVTLLIIGKRENTSLNGVKTTGYSQGKKTRLEPTEN